MKLRLDANVSGRLAARLTSHFEESLHVDYIGLSIPAKDIEIWDYALNNNLVIVTNDEDFLNLVNLKAIFHNVDGSCQ